MAFAEEIVRSIQQVVTTIENRAKASFASTGLLRNKWVRTILKKLDNPAQLTKAQTDPMYEAASSSAFDDAARQETIAKLDDKLLDEPEPSERGRGACSCQKICILRRTQQKSLSRTRLTNVNR